MIRPIQFDFPLAGLCLAAGLALGALFFGGLWATVSRAVESQNPALMVLLSFAARTAAALCAICLLAQGRPERAAACMVGFVIARELMLHRVAPGRRSRAHQPR